MKNAAPQQSNTKVKPMKFHQNILALGLAIGLLSGFGEFSGLTTYNSFGWAKATETLQPKTTHRIFGDVMDVYTEAKLAGVKVSVDKLSTLTDAKGHFELNVPIDKKKKFYKVNFSKKGYQDDYLDSISVNSKDKIMIGLMKPFKK
jgi:hypothetical protein